MCSLKGKLTLSLTFTDLRGLFCWTFNIIIIIIIHYKQNIALNIILFFCFLFLQVSIIQPGNFGIATNILPKRTPQDIWDDFDEARKLTFNQKYIEMACEYFNSLCTSGFKDCSMVINAMLHALTAPKPQTRYLLVSWRDMFFFYICPFLPTFITDSVFHVSSMYHKRKEMLYL